MKKSTPRKRKIEIEYEQKSPSKTKSMKKQQFTPPTNWKSIYNQLKEFRYSSTLPPAPVDTMGCDMLHAKEASPKEKRFQILISLLLSSQTKDPVTAEAMQKLHQLSNSKRSASDSHSNCCVSDVEGAGLTIDAVDLCTDEELNECIAKVGFHRKKTKYLRQVSDICRDQFDSDIPQTIEELLALPGIGPKMGYLALQAAWNRVEGIGVDTHVHRISSRLGWVPKGSFEKGPETTREALESWLPKEYWDGVNHLLVGLGQTICLPKTPKCSECAIRKECPSSSAKKD